MPEQTTKVQPEGDSQKQSYEPPTLTKYGSLARLTQSAKGSSTDGGQGGRMACL